MSKRVLIIAVVLAVCMFGVIYFGGTGPEPTGLQMVEVMPIVLDEETRKGERIFDENCAGCHGVNASGRDGIAPPLIHKIYKPSHHADIAFKLAAQVGVRAHHWPFGDMPPVSDV